MKNLVIILSVFFIVPNLFSQGLAVNNSGALPDASAMLDVSSTTKGVLIPRMTQAQRNLIGNPAPGLMIFQTDQSPGFYYFDGTVWKRIGPADFADGGESDGSDRSIGNTDDYSLSLITNNTERLKLRNDGGIRMDGNLGIFTDPKVPGINKAIDLYDSETFSNPYLKISGHNSAYINLESRRDGFTSETSGKSWRINSGSGSVLDLDKFYISNPDDGAVFTIRDGGNVGIGVDSALTKLQVDGNITFAPAGQMFDDSRFIGQSIASQSTFDAGNGFGGFEVENINKNGTDDSAQQLHFWTHNQGIDSKRRMTIDTIGRLGIGTAKPTYMIEAVREEAVSSITSTTYRNSGYSAGSFIGQAARGSKDSPSALQIGDFIAAFNARGYGSTSFSPRPRGRLAFTAAQNWTDSEQGSNMVFRTTSINETTDRERMRITSQGNVGIGETNPNHKLHVVQDSLNAQGLVISQNGNDNAATIEVKDPGNTAHGLRVVHNGDGNAGTFEITNTASNGNALNVYNSGNGYGLDLVIHNTGTGAGGRFTIDNPANNNPAIYGEHKGNGPVGQFITDGTGFAGEFNINNVLNNSAALRVNTLGTGSAGNFSIDNATNNFSTIFSSHNGIGKAGYFRVNNSTNSDQALYAYTNGDGEAIGADNDGDGIAGIFNITKASNNNTALEVKTVGGGSAGKFQVDNVANSDPILLIEGNGTGPSIAANGTIDMVGFSMPTSAIAGHVLTSDGSGVGSWQPSSFDYSNNGEAGTADRTLGNTDNFALGFLTNNSNRLQITNDGKIGIGTTSPGELLEVEGGADGSHFGISINQNTNSKGYPGLHFKDHNNSKVASILTHQNRVHLYFRLTAGDFIFDRSPSSDVHMILKDSGKLGIGTTTPDEKLHVAGNMRLNGTFEDKDGEPGVAGQLLSSTPTGTDWIGKSSIVDFVDGGESKTADRSLGNTDSYSLDLITNNTSRLHMSDDGKVGIGNISPKGDLHINDNIVIDRTSTNKDYMLGNNIYFDGTWKYLENGYGSMITFSENGTFGISTFGIGTANTSATISNKLYVNNIGNIGLTNTSPTSKLDIIGSTGYDQLRIRTQYTPTSSTDTNGNEGDLAWDDLYIYIKTSTGWKRASLSTW